MAILRPTDTWIFEGPVVFNSTMSPPSGCISSDSMIGAGASIARSKLAQEALSAFTLPWHVWRQWDHLDVTLPDTAANDDLGLVTGTFTSASPYLNSGDFKATTLNRYARCQFALPECYDAGETVKVRVHAKVTIASDTSAAIDLVCYENDGELGISADLCATAETSVNGDTDWHDYDFTITATNLEAGDLLDMRLHVHTVDSASGTARYVQIGAVKVLCDIRG